MPYPHMKRHNLLVTLVLATTILLAPILSAGASTTFEARRARGVPQRVCPIHWRRGPVYVRRLVWCVANRYHVPGGAGKAIAIANRESRFNPRAYNSYSGAEGVFQHLRRYWPGRAAAYGFRGWSGFNARANIFVTMRMVRHLGGWWPWGG
jgi:hypothetical protein